MVYALAYMLIIAQMIQLFKYVKRLKLLLTLSFVCLTDLVFLELFQKVC